jgi:hypothetical protein
VKFCQRSFNCHFTDEVGLRKKDLEKNMKANKALSFHAALDEYVVNNV